jgi:selenide,water dikinase
MRQAIQFHLVLVGGGHSHAIALKQLGMHPIPGVRVTLVSNVWYTPYSGMLPGYVAGAYDFDQCHIDLRPLATFAQATFIPDEVVGVDVAENRLMLAGRPPLYFDRLSLDIGSTPATSDVPGSAEYAIPVKPVSQFLAIWDAFVDEVARSLPSSLHLCIVGGGAGGVELALSVHTRLRRMYVQAGRSPDSVQVHLIQRGATLLPERSPWVQRRMQRVLRDQGIQIHLSETVIQVHPHGVDCQSGLKIACDRTFWVTQAAAASWLQTAGLATDARGFLRVNHCLQSVSHPQIFAAGDVATMVNYPRPKAGVFAVRQGLPLFENLRRSLLNQPLQPYYPQREFLILISTGDGRAVASRGRWGWGPAPWLWYWKDRIDRAFMDRFSHLSPIPSSQKAMSGALNAGSERQGLSSSEPMRCTGCGAKVGSSILGRSLQRIQRLAAQGSDGGHPVIGLEAPDDAAILRLPPDRLLVQTVDFFPSLNLDPFTFGQICAHHSLNDLFAMGATPHSALAIAQLPYGTERLSEDILYQLLSGAIAVLQSAGAMLIGGHTIEGEALSFGLSCNGLVAPTEIWRKGTLQPGQSLILTKALGTGMLFAADMRLQAQGRWIEGAIASMLQSNQAAVSVFRQYGATACTDISGFGLLGHVVEMLASSAVAVWLQAGAIPYLDGVLETMQQGIVSSLDPQNRVALQSLQNFAEVWHHPRLPLLVDPQTSGGLLAAVPESEAIACLKALQHQGYHHSAIVGKTVGRSPLEQPISLVD